MVVSAIHFLLVAVLLFLTVAYGYKDPWDFSDPSWDECREVYETSNFTWPPLKEEYVPNTEGWRRIMERRLRQMDALDEEAGAYTGYWHTEFSALIVPNFTENGWGLTRAPEGLVKMLVDNLNEGLKGELPEEDDFMDTNDIVGIPSFLYQDDLNQYALRVLKPILEAWSGQELMGNSAYGLRIYRNESSLNMHLDKGTTHIISAILHVGHDEDGEPWPLVIEDFQGNVNEVYLTPGDMVLYESSKCFHGRPTRFNGTWCKSICVLLA